MHRYSYDNCPVCGITFTESDDIVVCPHCGTPHHRECYDKLGTCANAERHEEGFTFVSDAPEEPAASEPETKAESNTAQSEEPEHTFEATFGPKINDGEQINGVPAGDLKKFIGPAWVYYIPLFLAKVKGIRIFRINFSAFIGSYVWLFARKFYLLGFISTLLNFASYFYLQFYYSYIKALGFDTANAAQSLLQSSDKSVVYGFYLYSFAYNLPFVLSVITGFFANTLYMNKSVGKVKKINKASKTAEEFNGKLEKKGGLNMFMLYLSLALTVCYYILESRGIIGSLAAQIIDKIL